MTRKLQTLKYRTWIGPNLRLEQLKNNPQPLEITSGKW